MTNLRPCMPIQVYMYPYDQPGYFNTYTIQSPVVKPNPGWLNWCKCQLLKLLLLMGLLAGWYMSMQVFCR